MLNSLLELRIKRERTRFVPDTPFSRNNVAPKSTVTILITHPLMPAYADGFASALIHARAARANDPLIISPSNVTIGSRYESNLFRVVEHAFPPLWKK